MQAVLQMKNDVTFKKIKFNFEMFNKIYYIFNQLHFTSRMALKYIERYIF